MDLQDSSGVKKIKDVGKSMSGLDRRQSTGFLLPLVGRALEYSYNKFSLCSLLNRVFDRPSTSELYYVH
jgi:hypothetical protein